MSDEYGWVMIALMRESQGRQTKTSVGDCETKESKREKSILLFLSDRLSLSTGTGRYLPVTDTVSWLSSMLRAHSCSLLFTPLAHPSSLLRVSLLLSIRASYRLEPHSFIFFL
jgi:hypothetical protein